MKKFVCSAFNVVGLFLLLSGIFYSYVTFKLGLSFVGLRIGLPLALAGPLSMAVVGLVMFVASKKCLNKLGSKVFLPVVVAVTLFALWNFIYYAPTAYINSLLG